MDQDHIGPFFEQNRKHGTPKSRDAWGQFFAEFVEKAEKNDSHSKLGHELLKFACDLKHVPGDKADRALHQLNVGQLN